MCLYRTIGTVVLKYMENHVVIDLLLGVICILYSDFIFV